MTIEIKSIRGKLCILAANIVFAVFVVVCFSKMRRVSQYSAYAALTSETVDNLNNYYLQHGRYPKSLAELPSPTFPDGGDPSYMSGYSYSSTSNSCELLVVSREYKWTGRYAEGKQIFGKRE